MFDLVTWGKSPWSIFDELESLQADMNRAFNGWDREARGGTRARPWRGRRAAYPLLNVWAAEDGLVIDAELPGVDPKDVDIAVLGDELTVRGKVNVPENADQVTYSRRERPSGEFARTLRLPFRAVPDGVKAQYKHGLLRLTVPRPEAEKPKKIEITA
jgi:HSP20 family protein